MKRALLLYALLSTLSCLTLCVRQKWVYSDRTRDRGGRLVTDVIDIDAENDEGQFEVDGSGNGTDDEGDAQSGDGDEESSGDVTILGACQLRRQQAISQSGHMIGMFIPRCTSSGHYEELQCHSGTGECWCVDRVDGLEMIGSRQRVPSMPDCTRFSVTTALKPSTEESLHSTSNRVITRQMQTPTSTSTSASTSSVRDELNNKINQFPSEPEIKYDGPADIDSNSVERSDQNIEPRRRKMSLRASVIGQPGILAGIIGGVVVILLCIVLLVMFCVYRVHRKSNDPEIFYIDNTARMPLSSNKKVGYMKALNPDHDMYG